MILKNLTRKKTGTGQLVKYIFRYILKEGKFIAQKDKKPLIIRHNIRSRTVEGFVKEFETNLKNRVHKRADQTIIHHTILSWSDKDAGAITDTMLKNIARRFIQLRGENNLYVGTKHTDRNHVHLHIAVSGNQINGKSSRLSQKGFADLKKSLTEYQRQQYPELIHSLPQHGRIREQRIQQKEDEQQEKKHIMKAEESQLTELSAIRAKKQMEKEQVLEHEPGRRRIHSPFTETGIGMFGTGDVVARKGISPG